jgi:hypothetical protein
LEMERKILKNSTRIFLTTGDAHSVEKLANDFYGQPIRFEQVKIAP